MSVSQIPLFAKSEWSPAEHPLVPGAGERAIETVDFPFEAFSDIAELESFRKEIYRPTYHIHKWWAQRLGSVFRAILIGAFAPREANLKDLFYRPVRLPGAVVFDPFMGSGTTVGEALKLGARAIGRDINPVAYSLVKNALGLPARQALLATFHAIERDIGKKIRGFYQARLSDGTVAEALYYFWVKQLDCPQCSVPVDLFSSYVFAQHAYPKRYQDAHVLCPTCGAINVARYDAERVECATCSNAFDPSAGPAKGVKATCPSCACRFPIAKVAREKGEPPRHRLYAKLVLTSMGEKVYLRADEEDRALYARAEQELRARKNAFPEARLSPGHNTNQALNYCYTHWYQMFGARQLLCLSILAERIKEIPGEQERGVFSCLFSGLLEFNNLFTSYKGEGTGAVRHMFSHHILKPERTPLEANLWGTPRSSGSFSTLFERRLLRALDYSENPFELQPAPGLKYGDGARLAGEKVFGLSQPLFHKAVPSYRAFHNGKRLYLSCGDSANTDIAAASVDAVITDPPFFDNVHYSELADFFYVWQQHIQANGPLADGNTTRSPREVQARQPEVFTERLGAVWKECHRVLKPEGLLIFTYHHSRAEGWRCLLESLIAAGFLVVRTHPIKAEMSGATPKHQAHEPIDLDIIIVCRKRDTAGRSESGPHDVLDEAVHRAEDQVRRLREAGRAVSRNDVRIIVMAQVLPALSGEATTKEALSRFDSLEARADMEIERLYAEGSGHAGRPARVKAQKRTEGRADTREEPGHPALSR